MPKSLKDSSGEIKSNRLSDEQLLSFAKAIFIPQPAPLVTALGFLPAATPPEVIDKHKEALLKGVDYGVDLYESQGKKKLAIQYREFGNWLRKSSYELFPKILLLGECLAKSLENAFGHSIVGKYELELLQLTYLIDRDFVRDQASFRFWRELLRNQLAQITKRRPIPILETWSPAKHPVASKYITGDRISESLFIDNLNFVKSEESAEVRMADAAATIVSRALNERRCKSAYEILATRLAADGRVTMIQLKDFDLDSWTYDPSQSPWIRENGVSGA